MNHPDQDSGNANGTDTRPRYVSDLINDARRRNTALTNRGVNTLSKEALDKKRDNDRKAQAAIRKRQKDEVARLKQEIEALNSRKPHLELKHLEQEKAAIQAENEKLRKALFGVMDTIQPFVAPAVQDLAAVARSAVQATPRSNPIPGAIPQSGPVDHSGYSSTSLSNGHEEPMSHRKIAFREQRDMISRQHQLNEFESLDFRCIVDKQTRQSPYTQHPQRRYSAGLSQGARSAASSGLEDQQWNRLPLIGAPSTEYEQILADFINDHRQPAATPPSTSYPVNPSISSLLNPIESSASSGSDSPNMMRHMQNATFADITPAPDALSNYMIRLISFFDDLVGLPEKVAVTFFMYSILRWLAYPTKENYELLPDIMKPRGAQFTVRHPAWFDTLPWPAMRERMCLGNHADFTFGSKWYDSFTPGLSVNWPFSEATCLAVGKDGKEEISPAFLEHISRIDSWTLDDHFFKTFPDLRNTALVKNKTDDAPHFYVPSESEERVTQGYTPAEPHAQFPSHGGSAFGGPSYGGPSYETQRYGGNGGRHDSFS